MLSDGFWKHKKVFDCPMFVADLYSGPSSQERRTHRCLGKKNKTILGVISFECLNHIDKQATSASELF